MNLKKEMNVNVYIAGAAGLGLLAGGASAGYLLCRRVLVRAYAERLEAELEATRLHYINKAAKEADPGELLAEAEEAASTADLAGDFSEAREWAPDSIQVDSFRITEEALSAGPGGAPDADEAGRPSGEHPVAEVAEMGEPEDDDRDHTHPYPISQAEFANTEPGWQAISLKFYSGDTNGGVLVDDQDNPIVHYEKLVGSLSPELFGGISGEAAIRLVRNDERECDFEILHVEDSYANAVLNYGRPK